MKYKLRVEEHEDFGTKGIVILNSGRDWFEPVSGMGIAHDILEHSTKPHFCPYVDELMALGGLVHLRYLNGYSANKSRSFEPEDITNELYNLARCYDRNVFVDSHSGSKTIREDPFLEFIDKACSLLPHVYYENENEELVWNRDNVKSYIIKGYQLSSKRFHHLNTYILIHSLFPKIEKQCESWLKTSEIGYTADLMVTFSKYQSVLIDTSWD